MKKVYWIFLVVILCTMNCSGYRGDLYYSSQEYNPLDDSSYVYNYLAPYGSWVEMSPYGYVWIPRHMGYRWRPYTEGSWAWTDYGWTWVSDYPWGDIPFHYGRWGWEDDLGWFWVPGDVWGPAWVTWRENDFYLGWAPIPPGISFSIGMDYDALFYDIPINYWVFVEPSHFYHHKIGRYAIPPERNRTIINYTSLRNNFRVRENKLINEGIDVNEVHRITGNKINQYQIRDLQKPGRAKIAGQQVEIFRPQIKNPQAGRPKEFLNKNEAQQKLAPVKILEPPTPQKPGNELSVARRKQDEERKILNRTQTQEIDNLNRKRAEEEKRIQDNAQREKIKKDYENRMSELKKQHEAEKKDIQNRHSNDSTFIKKNLENKPPREQNPPPPPPRKKKN